MRYGVDVVSARNHLCRWKTRGPGTHVHLEVDVV